MIQVENLVKVFRSRRTSVRALDGVSFTCRPGEVYGLLGPNGAGKTTTLRILSTVLKPTEGAAWVDGVAVTENPDQVRRRIGFLSGTTGIYGRLTAREMVRYFGCLYGLAGDALEDRIQEIFTHLGMMEFADRRGDRLSTGMQQKVNIARTIVHDPPVLVLDEPTAGLDVITSRAILDLIATWRERGKTVLFSTHIMSEAEGLCDRIGILHEGRIYAEGSPAEVRARTGEPTLERAFLKLVGEAA